MYKRPEAAWWLDAAQRDEAMARSLSEDTFYEGASFHLQQAAEKYLKALAVSLGERARTHSCVRLLTELQEQVAVSPQLLTDARKLDPHYINSRYPNGAGGPPREQYDERIVEELSGCLERIKHFVSTTLR